MSGWPSSPAPLVLASASPRRRELLRALGVPFAIRATDVAETLEEGVAAGAQAERLALAKATAGLPHPAISSQTGQGPAIVIGADTIVVLDGKPLGKPHDSAEARWMLRALRGRTHQVVTGIAVVRGEQRYTDSVETAVSMRLYSDTEIEAYIATGDPFDKAGAYAIQHPVFVPVAHIDGCYCNVVGLPLWTLREMLSRIAPDLATRPPSAIYQRCAACPLAPAHEPVQPASLQPPP